MLALTDLRRSFADVVALDGVSLQAAPGQMVGFVGRNGAGKTTMMRIALGLLEPHGGTATWMGRSIDDAARLRFGYMPEERGLYPKMRVDGQLAYLGELAGLSRAEAEGAAATWIDRLGLADRATARVQELSLGNQQRVQLAAALLHRPDVLVLDEPFSGLDPVGVDVLASALQDEVARGAACVFSSHQLELVERLCDAVVIIDAGRPVADGTIAELRAGAGARLLRVELEGGWTAWAERLPGITDRRPSGAGLVLTLADGTDPDSILDAARSAGQVRQFGIVEPSLADLFRSVVAA